MNQITQEQLASLRLIRSENVGPRTFFSLIKAFKTAQTAMEKISYFPSNKQIKLCSKEQAMEEVERTLTFGAELIFYSDASYPALLKEIPDYPPVITVAGKWRDLLLKDKVAIVGSRSSSVNGSNFAYKIASKISEGGYVIVSGLARGIDDYVHQGSLKHGTIAVIASGIDHVYPPENKNLYRAIMDNGLIITEQPFGSLPKAIHFPQRNRIISGLSLAVLVIEANVKSGSLITARCAAEQNREVFAVPGFPLDIRYSGTNFLIKQGAYLLENEEDVFNVLRQGSSVLRKGIQLDLLHKDTDAPAQQNETIIKKELDKTYELVLSLLGTTPVSIDQLVGELNIPMSTLSVALIDLELAGKIERVGNNKVVLVI